MDSGMRATELESQCKRSNEGDHLLQGLSSQNFPNIGKVSDISYELVKSARKMEAVYLKMKSGGIGIKAEEECRRLEAEKRNLGLDLELSVRTCDEKVQKLQAAEAEIVALKSLLERRDGKVMELGEWVPKMEEAINKITRAKGFRDLQSSGGKKRLEENKQMKVDVFLQRIPVSDNGKRDKEAEDCTLEREISREKEKVLCNNAALEAKEKEITELLQRIEVLKEENRVAIGASHANREKSEFERNLKEEQERENLKLVHRIGILENGKKDLQDEVRLKDEMIQVLMQENESLDNNVKKLNMAISTRAVKTEIDAELPQQIHVAKDGCTLGNLTQNQGKKSACFPHSDEQSRSLSYGIAIHAEVNNESGNKAGNPRKRPSLGNLGGGRSTEETESFGTIGNSSIVMQKRGRTNP